MGQEILVLFGLSIYSFQVAGGILLLIIAIRILVSGNIHENVESTESLGAVPIAMPLLVGPGAITATMFNLQTYGIVSAILAVIIVLSITWIILRSINIIYKILGKTGALVIARVMALLIAAIAIQYILMAHHFYNINYSFLIISQNLLNNQTSKNRHFRTKQKIENQKKQLKQNNLAIKKTIQT